MWCTVMGFPVTLRQYVSQDIYATKNPGGHSDSLGGALVIETVGEWRTDRYDVNVPWQTHRVIHASCFQGRSAETRLDF